MKPKGFQIKASEQIAERYRTYIEDPLWVRKNEVVPFYQNLSAITGSGKTLILAETAELIRSMSKTQPIVLWLSKGKVVVGQTLDNLTNGKYADNIPGYEILPLLSCKKQNIIDDQRGLILVATVGKFNQKDKVEGDRKIFQTGLDNANDSIWEMLKKRINVKNEKRELIIIYDEGHNLSDQQLDLLIDLNPEALIAASATTKVPKKLETYIERHKRDNGAEDKDLITFVSNSKVVNEKLIKKHIVIGGYLTPMEEALDSLLDDYERVLEACENNEGVEFVPKVIYVSNTNVLLKTSKLDNPSVPFDERNARPIEIWRHLVNKGVNPKDIAVYCELKFDKKFPKPNDFNLFSRGENDYTHFIEGNYKHIIFNQSLQEGWDDPACYFAYIDKDMGSNTQITQIIGRVLRQPNVEYYPDENLNTAFFYIQTDEKDAFKTIINDVQKTYAVDIPELEIVYRSTASKSSNRTIMPPKEKISLPNISVNAKEAEEPIAKLLDQMNDYRKDEVNTIGLGNKIQAKGDIGSDQKLKEAIVETSHSNKVSARWIFNRELRKLSKRAEHVYDASSPKFDALIEYNSAARTHINEYAKKLVELYRKKSVIVYNSLDKVELGGVFVGTNSIKFVNAVHEEYSDFNSFEREFATELDKLGLKWLRNPSSGYYEVPLLDGKGTENFNPDFVVWGDNKIFLLDTKGAHLILSDSKRKLLFIEPVCSEDPKVIIRLISEKKYNAQGEVIDSQGFTLWSKKQGEINTTHYDTIEEIVRDSVC